MKRCPHCEALNDDNRKWCGQCMKVFGNEVETIPEPQTIAPPVPVQTYAPITPAENRRRIECPYCHTVGQCYTKSNTTTGGIIMMVVLLFLCLPLFWVPLLTMTERHAYCDACKMRIN